MVDQRSGPLDPGGWVVSRRGALRALGAAIGTAALAACAPIGSSGPTPGSATSTSTSATASTSGATATTPVAAAPASGATPQPKSGGTLRAGLTGDITTIWPVFGGTSSWEVNEGMYDWLMLYDHNLQPQPGLIESWEQSSDLKQLKLNLRKGVQFHTGRDFTSDDVKYTLLRATDPAKTSPLTLVGLAKVWQLDTPDKYTLVMQSDQPRIGAFDLLTQLTVGDHETLDGPDQNSKGIGTGPFKFVEWVQGDHITFSRNPNYWQSGRPYLDGYQFNFYRDAQAMITALESGALDLVSYPQIQDALRLRADPHYQLQAIYDAGTNFAIWVTTTHAPFDNKQVRQAMNYAMDRQRITDTVLGGLVGSPKDLPWATYSPAYQADKNAQYAFDLDKARSLLKAAGVGPFDAVVNYASDSGPVPEWGQIAQIFQSDLNQIGVNLKIVPLETAIWTQTAVTAGFLGFGIGMPGNFGAQDATSGLASGAFGVANPFTGFKDDTYTQLVQSAATETDASKRKDLYSKINDLILDQCFTMTISSFLQSSATTNSVHNVVRQPVGGYLSLTDTWMG
jgi:peptide/nickel transport system substrate-binding protein